MQASLSDNKHPVLVVSLLLLIRTSVAIIDLQPLYS